MASLARSTRRAEGLHPRRHQQQHHLHHPSHPRGALHHRQKIPLAPRAAQPTVAAAGVIASYHDEGGRQKRRLNFDDAAEREFDALRSKKARIAIEILTNAAGTTPPDKVVAGVRARRPARPAQRQPPLVSVGGSGNPGQPPALGIAAGPKKAEAKPTGLPNSLPPGDGPQGRKLRSQEASRYKSDLSAFFPDYDEVIGNEAKEEQLFTADTPIVVYDSQRQNLVAAEQPPPPPAFAIRSYADSLYTDVVDCQRIDFGFLENRHHNSNSENLDDPLPDSVYEPSHKKALRLERSYRNTERGRAQHERDQITRLLAGLQGHEWLRVMGVSGVTDTKKKTFEPARAYFIKGCRTILDKFRDWTREEKRRKLERGRAASDLAGQDSKGENQMTIDGRVPHEQDGARRRGRRSAHHDLEDASAASQNDEVSPSPAQQLQQEAMARSQMTSGKTTSGMKRPRPPSRPVSLKPPSPPRPFRSFFAKRHEREAALNRKRRAGRTILAWGHAIPDMEEVDFELPEEYRDPATLKARARKKRLDRRGKATVTAT